MCSVHTGERRRRWKNRAFLKITNSLKLSKIEKYCKLLAINVDQISIKNSSTSLMKVIFSTKVLKNYKIIGSILHLKILYVKLIW